MKTQKHKTQNTRTQNTKHKNTKHKTQNTKHKTQKTKNKKQYINSKKKKKNQFGKGLEEEFDLLIIEYMKKMHNHNKEINDTNLLIMAIENGINFINFTNLEKKSKNSILSYQADFFNDINSLLWSISISKNPFASETTIRKESILFSKNIYSAIKDNGFKYNKYIEVFRGFTNIDNFNEKLRTMEIYSFIEYNSFISTSAIKSLYCSKTNCAKIIIPINIPFLILSIGGGENEILLNPGTLLKIDNGNENFELGTFIFIPIINNNLNNFFSNKTVII